MSANKKDLNKSTKAELDARLCELFGSLKSIGLEGLMAVAKVRRKIAKEKIARAKAKQKKRKKPNE